MIRIVWVLALSLAMLPTTWSQQSWAQQGWPDKPIRVIVPLPAGAAVDVVGRLIMNRLGERLGQIIVVENRAGASGALGAEAVAKAAPDGYTLGMATSSTHVTTAILNAKLPYDPVKDFAPVALIGLVPYTLAVAPKLPANNLKELLALARAKPKTLSYSTIGVASQGHLAAELMSTMAGIQLNHVPYRTSFQAILDLAEGRIDITFGILATLGPLIKDGRIRALAVTTEKRSADIPDVPTMAEAGLPGFEASLWFAVVAPAALPPALLTRLNREINAILSEPEITRALSAHAITVELSTPDALRETIRVDIEKWRAIAVRAGVKPE
jgi:tripartite-type tricarboxylate transporter receptor subunit TctC